MPLTAQPTRGALAGRVIVPAFIAQNFAFGISQGSFGPLLQSNADHFDVSPGTMVLCASALNLALGLGAPTVSSLMDRISLRSLMIAGSLVSAVGYFGLFASDVFAVALAMYFLLGIGCAILGVLTPLALINHWLPHARGRALGWINAPTILLLVPLLIGGLMPSIGRGGLFLAAVLLLLATIPLFAMVPNESSSEPASSPAAPIETAPRGGARKVLSSGSFWTVALAIGVLAGMSSAFIVNVVAVGGDRGMSFQAAASLVSVFAASGAVGSVGLGWLCDRIGALPTVAIAALCLSLLCIAFVVVDARLTFALVALTGFFSAPILTLMGAAVSQIIAPDLVNRAIGTIYFVKLPFIFVFAPLFEFLSHYGERFSLSFTLMAIALGLTAGALFVLHLRRGRSARSALEPAPS